MEHKEEIDKLSASAKDKAETLEIAKEVMNKTIPNFEMKLFMLAMTPLMLKGFKDVDPETYYGFRAKLKSFVKILREAANDIDERLEKTAAQ